MTWLQRGSGILVLAAIIALWQLLAMLGIVTENQLASPTKIIAATIEELQEGTLAREILATARRIIVGFSFAVVFGVLFGFALGRSKLLHAAFEPIIEFLRPMPVVAILPIAIFVLGLGDRMTYSVVAFASGWIILLHAMDGIRSIDPVLIDTGRTFHVRPLRQFLTIALPASAPHTFTGMRVGFGIAVIVTVVVELISGFGGGLGDYIGVSQGALRVPEAYSGIVLVAILGYCLAQLFALLERRLMTWHHGFKQQAR
jgi:sulfonate transport system permease protein